MTPDLNIGRLLIKRYQIVRLVGKGAMGRVYLAKDKVLGDDVLVAVKFLAQTLLSDKMRDRFRVEARTCAQLGQKSNHIVRVTDFGVDDQDVPFYVMEYLQGESLSEIIKIQPVPLPRFLSLARQICLGLQCAHQGFAIEGRMCPIIHRDIKPSNILVSQDALVGELVKILDFGIAKLIQDDNGQTNSFMGTLAYSSPEQMEGRELDARSDIYSLGVMMFEMLTGKMPLQAETHAFGSWYKAHHFQAPRTFEAVNPGLKLPKALELLVMSCLAKLPADRPQGIADVLRALEPLEQRYNASRNIGNRIGEVLAKQAEQFDVPVKSLAATDNVCHQAIWPANRPIAKIVFSQPLHLGKETQPAVWCMLQQAEVDVLQVHKFSNRIYQLPLCIQSPHPMVLWGTALYNHVSERKTPWWLPCYLDLKTTAGQEMLRLISEKGQYQILLFGLDNSDRHCAHSITVKLSPLQVSQWQEWAITSASWVSVGSSTVSKNLLQAEWERQKPRIAEELRKSSEDILL